MTPWDLALAAMDSVPKNKVVKLGRPYVHPVIDGEKHCSRCDTTLPLSSFRYQESIRRYRGECRMCEAAKRREERCS